VTFHVPIADVSGRRPSAIDWQLETPESLNRRPVGRVIASIETVRAAIVAEVGARPLGRTLA
jgi:hypothetical protein